MTVFVDRRQLYAAVLRHTGRRPGKEDAIPVVVPGTSRAATSSPSPTGKTSTGFKNARASGRCTTEAGDGVYTLALGEPEAIGTEEALAAMPPRARLMFKTFGHERRLKPRRSPGEAQAPSEDDREGRARRERPRRGAGGMRPPSTTGFRSRIGEESREGE